MADDRFYRVHVTYDGEAERFVARLPELEAEGRGETRAQALEALEASVETRVEQAAVDGETLPPPIDAEAPSLELQLTLAPSVARELRFQARRADLSVEVLAGQLVAQGLGPAPAARRGRPAQPSRRPEVTEEPAEAETQPTPPSQGPKRAKNRRRRHEGYRADMEDQANFLAYVRDMEKGGGGRRRG